MAKRLEMSLRKELCNSGGPLAPPAVQCVSFKGTVFLKLGSVALQNTYMICFNY